MGLGGTLMIARHIIALGRVGIKVWEGERICGGFCWSDKESSLESGSAEGNWSGIFVGTCNMIRVGTVGGGYRRQMDKGEIK